jgi:signal transduction histidine kinase
MGYPSRGLSEVGARRLIVALGVVYVALAGGQLLVVTGIKPPTAAVIGFVLVGGPGLVLVVGGYQLSRTEFHPSVYPRILGWCLAGFGLLLAVVGLRVLDPGVTIDNPFASVVLATALGSVAGFAIGLYDARAISRARKAEQYSHALKEANDRLETQHQRLESFAGMLAHELRNPLQIAQIYHQQEQPRNEAAAEEVATAHDRIEEMIDILLVTVRGKSDSTNVEPVSVADVAREAWAAVTTDAVGDDLVVETDCVIQADPVHLRHLFGQLFRNSIEHADSEVTVRVGDLADREGFYIEDDGPGIPEDARDDVVEAGYTTIADATGLGLTFVAQLAQTYEWGWTITEGPTGGARFEFTDVAHVSTEEKEELHQNGS